MEQNMNPIPPGAGGSYDYQERIEPPPVTDPYPERHAGFSIASLVLGIVSMLGFCLCCVHIITAPLAIIFGSVSLAKKRDGKGLAITGVILGVLSIVMSVALLISLRPVLQHMDVISQDLVQLCEEQDEVFPAYEKDGTLPDYLRKYQEDPYKEMLSKYDITIYDVMDMLLTEYKNGRLNWLDRVPAEPSVPEESETAEAAENAAFVFLPLRI
ncbi:MAG: DUF4190 domain-containing protein [Oscillospiraceae bacterium]|nr:DUF4190 domain-containing protein [Oscillospiraceae bacterium]